MTAGKMAAGYNEAESIVVLNTSGVALSRGETVIWDASAVASTDVAPRITRQTADASAAVAGVLCSDVAIGGYVEMFVRGRCKARVHSSVTAGSVLINDYVSGTAAGILKNRATPGDYPACAYAITAATEEPVAGSGNYWATVVLVGENMAPLQQVARGGGIVRNTLATHFIGVALTGGADTFDGGYIRMPTAGSIVRVSFISSVGFNGNAGNHWSLQLLRTGNTGPVINTAGVPFDAGGYDASQVAVVANTVVDLTSAFLQAANTVVAADEILKVRLTETGTATDSLAAARFSVWVTIDTGLQVPILYGR